MSATSRREVLKQARPRYGGRGKAGRSRLLNEICVLCGYERKYASKLLRGRRPIAGESGKCGGGSQRIYAAAEREVIKAIWLSAEQPCGKRLKAAMPLWLPFYEKRHGQLESKVKAKVLAASAATIDRLLAPCRISLGSRGRCGTRPGTPLAQSDPHSHRALGGEWPGFYRSGHRGALR